VIDPTGGTAELQKVKAAIEIAGPPLPLRFHEPVSTSGSGV